MAGEIHGVASWPGVLSVESVTYTISHGITPGVAILRCSPQPNPPASFGDLAIGDGQEEVTVPDCKLDALKVEQDDKGFFWSLEIVDRRWRWREMGGMFGLYNQLDPHGKLIPWTIRSPVELAILCLNAMGEAGYQLDLPPGLDSGAGRAIPAYLPAGLNFPPTGVNPPISWEGIQPALALQQLADMFGRRVVYQLGGNNVAITQLGRGAALPPGSISKAGPSLKTPDVPRGVKVVGAPIRYQLRLALEPVGEEWDGSYWPIDMLSYAPALQPPVPERYQLTPVNPSNGVTYKVTFDDLNGHQGTVGATCTDNTVAGACNAIVTAVNTAITNNLHELPWSLVQTPTTDGNTVTILGVNQQVPLGTDESFEVTGDVSPPLNNPPQSLTVTLLQAIEPDQGRWDRCGPPLFPNVQATDRLTFEQARQLAQKHIWRTYRVINRDVSGQGPINVPGYGRLFRLQQLVLTDTKVEQVAPSPPVQGTINKATGEPYLADYYNGYSRDQSAAVYGSYCYPEALSGLWYANMQMNSPLGSRVLVPFSVDPETWTITFAGPVFYFDLAGGRLEQPFLQLECAVYIRNPDSNQLERFSKTLEIPGSSGADYKVEVHEDLQAEVYGVYKQQPGTDFCRLAQTLLLDTDPIARANYYLQAMLAQYQLSGAAIVEYNGIRAIDLDGAVQQVTWIIDGEGSRTKASRNCEHHLYIPPYPARRRAELLPPLVQKDQKGQRVDLPNQK